MSPKAYAVEHGNREYAAPIEGAHRPRLLMIGSHFVQYASPVFRQIAVDGRIDLLVAYCSMQGAESGIDPEFGVKVSWDTSVSEGYSWVHVPNRARRPGLGRFFGLVNPGLWKLIRDGHFDAVWVSGYFYASAWIGIAAAKWYGIPVMFITDSYGLRSLALRSSWKLRIKRIVVPRIFSLAKVVLALSSGGVEYMKTLGFPSDRIVLTPYVVDNKWWTEQAAKVDRNAVRASWKIQVDAPVVLFCAKLQPWKAPLDLLEAFARARAPEAYLVFAGDGALRSSLEQRSAELGIADRVRFLGFMNQSQLPSVYCASDMLVLPSHYDAFGLVVNEAMICGLPVVISDCVGAKFDLLRPGETGYIFPIGDVDALSAILKDLLHDPDKRSRMGASARQRMESWSPREFADGVARAVNLAAKKSSSLPRTV
jgi:glycosyltransferase involved in cell wall biosynthesis